MLIIDLANDSIGSSDCRDSTSIHVNNFSKSARSRDILFVLKDISPIGDEKLFKVCRSVPLSVPRQPLGCNDSWLACKNL